MENFGENDNMITFFILFLAGLIGVWLSGYRNRVLWRCGMQKLSLNLPTSMCLVLSI